MSKYCVNLSSYKLYNFSTIDNNVLICRIGDEKEYLLTNELFSENYRSLMKFETSRLKVYLEKYKVSSYLSLKDLFESIEDWQESKNLLNDKKKPSFGNLLLPDCGKSLDQLVLHPLTKQILKESINYCRNYEGINKEWGLDHISQSKCILNFYGPPGTGKTIASTALGKELGQPVLHIDYSKLISKYVGETGKNISNVFNEAKKLGAILLLDEADTLISKRMSVTGSNSFYINQEINTFMQELDRYNGILILTSNFFENFDHALLRRISHHIEFKLPNFQMRRELIKVHIPKVIIQNKKFEHFINLERIASLTEGFSGGDISNLITNSIKTAASRSLEDPGTVIKEVDLIRHIELIKSSKKSHNNSFTDRRISLL